MSKPESPSFGMQRQLAIYRRGVQKERPAQPVDVEDLRRKAQEVLSPEAWDYLDGGAGAGDTMRANRAAFFRWRIVPRMLRGVSQPDLSVEVAGARLPSPVLLAPVGVQSVFHRDAEAAVARAAASLQVPFVLSTVSSRSLEEVAAAMGESPRWFQLYWSRNREFAASLLERAEKADFSALIVTLDTLQLGWRPRDIENAYLPFLFGHGVGNYFSDPVFLAGLEKSPEEDLDAATRRFAELFADPTLTWDDLSFLREHTSMPIYLKGILHPDDARKAVDHGIEGVVVSNHGGRQVDGSIGALEALPAVVEAAGDRLEILLDSGVRNGADIFKALALGARAVLLGRPYVYGLAVRGEGGVRDVLHNLLAELDLTMSLAGCSSFQEVGRHSLASLP